MLLRILGQLVFATAYVVATLLVARDAVAGRSTVGDVVLAVSLAALVNQQVTSAVTLLQIRDHDQLLAGGGLYAELLTLHAAAYQ